MSRDRRLTASEQRLSRLRVPRAMRERFDPYVDEPTTFAADVLGMTSATRRSDGTSYQNEWLRAVADHSQVALRCGHGVGKTRVLGVLALWWLLTRPYSRVSIIAPQFDRQVRGVIFAEIRKLARRARMPLPVLVQAGRAPVTGFGDEWAIIGLPSTEPDRIEGQHAEGGVLLLMDETKGVGQDVFDAMQGALTGGEDSRLVVASTPGGPSGPFYRACTNVRGAWHVLHLSSEDSSLVAPAWCAERAADWGRESPLFVARVSGEFPDAGEGILFPLHLVEAAQNRSLAPGAVILGVDVARSTDGDASCIAVCRGGVLERLIVFRTADTMVVTRRVVDEAARVGPLEIRVDLGGPGAGVADRLRELGYATEGVYFGGGALDARRFRNRRAEMGWTLREAMERGAVSLPDDDELAADLAALRYEIGPDGRILLEAKAECRRRLGRSPDRFDAAALAIGGDGGGASLQYVDDAFSPDVALVAVPPQQIQEVPPDAAA